MAEKRSWYTSQDIPEPGDLDTAHKIVRARRQMAVGQGDKWADSCCNGELVMAALAYLVAPGDEVWPFAPEDFVPGDPADNMVAAGAFLAAEGDRIRRAQEAGEPFTTGLIMLGLDPETVDRCVDGLRNIQSDMRKIREESPRFP